MKKEEIKNNFIKYLKDNDHRITNERLLILDSALSMNDHFDADELYLKMKQNYIRASRATVYKTLDLMSECAILRDPVARLILAGTPIGSYMSQTNL